MLKGDSRPGGSCRTWPLLQTSLLVREAAGTSLQRSVCESCFLSSPPGSPSRVDPAWQCFKGWRWSVLHAGHTGSARPVCAQTSPDLAPGNRWSPVPKSHGAGVLVIMATGFWLSRQGKGVCCFHLLEGKKIVVSA